MLGLLGPNGAGKSTTFNILTMDIPASYGDVDILKQDIRGFQTQVNGNKMGLCAQFNTIWEKLTVDEHFDFIGTIKGLSKAES